LNFTSGKEGVESAIAQCGIRRIVTSRLFLAKARMEERAGMVFVEDLLGGISKFEKVIGLLASYLPAFVLKKLVAGGESSDMATVIFSSGSSGLPKGVMLSHQNVMSNIEASGMMIHLGAADRIAGVLPFFHSFGFTFTLWFPLVKGIGGVYQMNPLDAKGVGTLVEKFNATVLLATPTFLANYTKVVSPEQFRSLKLVLAGAEKLRESVVEGFAARFGVTPREGYGATEMAPVIAVSVEDVVVDGLVQKGWSRGSVGRPLPGVAVRVVDVETGRCCRWGMRGCCWCAGRTG
jgi:acyl-[acyl-carrier-protein]-phospholipid O-acyltransferase/long-chain-fatty-acid--[acyl-carrier-protein] ligase